MTKSDAKKSARADDASSSPSKSEQGKEIRIRLSQSLHDKLLESAHDEGIGVDELAKEILAEGVTMRIWDILERRARTREGQMLQNHGQNASPGNQKYGHHKGHGNHKGGGNHHGRGNSRHERYQDILNDSAAFMDYVRKKEGNQR
jgi:hypothetical protein